MSKGTATGGEIDQDAVSAVRRYLAALPRYGIQATCAMIFGSFARGEQDNWSDIDLLVISPDFDEDRSRARRQALWDATADIDSRIEPVACGEQEWANDNERMIIEIVRHEGVKITL